MSKKFAYIIPLHKEDKRVVRAIESIPEGAEVYISIPYSLEDWLAATLGEDSKSKTIVSEGSTYPSLVNAGLKYPGLFDVDFINILEFDDTVMEHAHRVVEEYANDWTDVEMFAPLACVVKEQDDPDEKPVLVGIANEASMAPQVAEEFGLFDFNMMLRTNFIFVNGCYIKPSVFTDYGMFKENFELFYDYEWALRVVYNGGIIRSIPKATHFHAITEDGAFETQKALPSEDRENWLGAARREYFFEEDREISFE